MVQIVFLKTEFSGRKIILVYEKRNRQYVEAVNFYSGIEVKLKIK